jgi:hypothetical protein
MRAQRWDKDISSWVRSPDFDVTLTASVRHVATAQYANYGFDTGIMFYTDTVVLSGGTTIDVYIEAV